MPVRREDPGEELILPSFPHRFVINVVIDCRLSNVFLQNPSGKSVSDFSTPPFHVSGFTLLLLYVLLRKILSETPVSFIEITTQGR